MYFSVSSLLLHTFPVTFWAQTPLLLHLAETPAKAISCPWTAIPVIFHTTAYSSFLNIHTEFLLNLCSLLCITLSSVQIIKTKPRALLGDRWPAGLGKHWWGCPGRLVMCLPPQKGYGKIGKGPAGNKNGGQRLWQMSCRDRWRELNWLNLLRGS